MEFVVTHDLKALERVSINDDYFEFISDYSILKIIPDRMLLMQECKSFGSFFISKRGILFSGFQKLMTKMDGLFAFLAIIIV